MKLRININNQILIVFDFINIKIRLFLITNSLIYQI